MKDDKLLEWRQYGPLADGRHRLQDLEGTLCELAARRPQVEEQAAALETQVEDARAGALIGGPPAGAALEARAAEARHALEDLDRKEREHARACELLKDRMPALEREAVEVLSRNLRRLYRPAVARLLETVKAAIAANAEVSRIIGAASEQLPEYPGRRPDGTPALAGLPDLKLRSLEETTSAAWGPCELSKWLAGAAEFLSRPQEELV